jgi:hypothetical protein
MALTQNFPQPPGRFNRQSRTFPEDLIQSNRGFYTNISLVNYEYSLVSSGLGAISYGGGFKLPIPRRLNDNEVILWEEWSGINAIQQGLTTLGSYLPGANQLNTLANAGLAGIEIGGMFGTGVPGISQGGETISPFMYMMYKRPGFKEFTLSWTLAPNTQSESDTLLDIIKECKKAALPSIGSAWGLQKYPKIALVSFKPEKYLFKLKPCAIISVQVDYNGSGTPSFFKSGAPTIINLTLQLKEIQLWTSEEIT